MADNADDLQNIDFIFQGNEKPTLENIECYPERKSVYLGETVPLYVVVSRRPDENAGRWKSRICQVAASGNFSIIDETRSRFRSPKKTPLKSVSANAFTACPVVVTLSADSLTLESNTEDKERKAFFIDDKYYLVPVTTSLSSLDGSTSRINVSVCVWMCTSPLDPTPDQIAKKDFHLDHTTGHILKKKTIQQQTVSKEVSVINPPILKIKVTSSGGKHLLLVHVLNKSNQSVELFDLNILNTSSKYSVEESGSHMLNKSPTGAINNVTSRIHFSKLGSNNLPCCLLPEEEMSFVFSLYLENLNRSISELELYFKAQLKWRHSSSDTDVITVYRLPKFCVRYAPFIISIGCAEDVSVGKSFTLTYNIVNKLQDFLSMKLYWSLKQQLEIARQKGEGDSTWRRLEKMNRAVICHDPDIYVGACPKGSSVPVPVSFQILEPGLFEFSDLMKVNLRYALPDSQSTLKQESLGTPVSIDTTSTLSADDQLAASEELWRDRSGSTSSLNTPTSESAEEKRKSFATKSYSFGDLGPTLSTDSDEARRTKFKNIKRSSAVPPPRPPPPRLLSQVEKDVTNPSNFLKKSFQVYIPHQI